jgi:hypothetical protein
LSPSVEAEAQLACDNGAGADAALAHLGDHTNDAAIPALLNDLGYDVGVEQESFDHRSTASTGSSCT